MEALLAVVLCTIPTERAEPVARVLLEKRVAACVNVLPGVTSLYWWQGAIEKAAESLLVIKTRSDRVAELTEAIKSVHPYELPEVLMLPVEPGAGNTAYRLWVSGEASPRI